ncbi:twin-arginine translocation signal domain-containing protein [Streptomyces sp. NPDC058595]|uniref:twin-arginine translocation signal domain-containing protein n=1 Tax=Streptomyces sp. NPDC058595 TaxID=3346550 RepID=UPI00366209F5
MEQRSRRGFVTLAAATGGLLVAGTPAEAIAQCLFLNLLSAAHGPSVRNGNS